MAHAVGTVCVQHTAIMFGINIEIRGDMVYFYKNDLRENPNSLERVITEVTNIYADLAKKLKEQ